MSHKTCAVINTLFTVALVGFCAFTHNASESELCFFLIAAFMAVSVGCWTRRRWLVRLAGASLIFASLGFALMAMCLPAFFRKEEIGIIIVVALAVCALEVASLFSVQPSTSSR